MAKTSKRPVPDDYLALVKQFALRPIRSEAEYDRAATILDDLAGRTDLSRGKRDYLDALTRFVEDYDDEHHAIEATASPIELLKEMMDQKQMTTTRLGELLGSKGVASEILNGKRRLNLNQMYKLAGFFGVEPAVFLERRSLAKSARV